MKVKLLNVTREKAPRNLNHVHEPIITRKVLEFSPCNNSFIKVMLENKLTNPPVMKSVKDRVRVELGVAGPNGDPLWYPAGQGVQVNVTVRARKVVSPHHL